MQIDSPLLVFRLDENLFAWPGQNVSSIVYGQKYSPLPFVTPLVAGVSSFNKEIHVIYDTKKCLDLPGELGETILILKDKKALLVDEVLEITPISIEKVHSSSLSTDLIFGAQDSIFLIDVNRFFKRSLQCPVF